ncbi:MAG: arsenate reductase (glutaredoxin) [Flavobacteriales bacterium]
MKIYHNPRCSKSRQTLNLIQGREENIEIIEYLKDNLNVIELEEIIAKLGISPMELVRKKEQIWIKNYKGKDLTDKEIVEVMVKYPKIMERPIVINGEKAIIGRPPENALKMID